MVTGIFFTLDADGTWRSRCYHTCVVIGRSRIRISIRRPAILTGGFHSPSG